MRDGTAQPLDLGGRVVAADSGEAIRVGLVMSVTPLSVRRT